MQAINQTPQEDHSNHPELTTVDLNENENANTNAQNNVHNNGINNHDNKSESSTNKTSPPRIERKVRFAPEEIQVCVEPTRQPNNNPSNLEMVEMDSSTPETMWLYLSFFALKVYSGLEYLGEKLANLFGITDSRYQYVLDEHNRIEEEKAKKLKRQLEKQNQQIRGLEAGVDTNSTTTTSI